MHPVALPRLVAVLFVCLATFGRPLHAQPADVTLPAWTKTVGAQRTPDGAREFRVRVDPSRRNGGSVVTAEIQAALDACAAAGGGRVVFDPGVYLTGALFVPSAVELHVDAGVTLRAVHDNTAYPRQPTRVAGIEMPWPAGLLNVNEAENVLISGDGEIDGDGAYWWDNYWRLRRDYDPRGLRWAADYDCERVRLIVVRNSRDVTVSGLHLRRSGFWNVHVLYSEHVTVRGLTLRQNEGPSTDGVDVDSSRHVMVEGCDIDNNDDCICLKAGRDFDGLRVNRPTEYVVVRDNLTRRGGGVLSFGSETSGGIQHVVAWGNRGIGTQEGLRFKSARTRGGFIRDVQIFDTTMEGVTYPFTFTLNWNPRYSYATLPRDVSKIPEHWRTLAARVEPPERGLTDVRDITIAGVRATGARRIFTASGLPGMPLTGVQFQHIRAEGKTAGTIRDARQWTFEDCVLTTEDGAPVKTENVESVTPPPVRRRHP